MRKKRPKVPFYPAYTNAYKHYHAENVGRYPVTDIELLAFESWLLSQNAHFHLRSPTMKQNRWIYFDNDEDMLLFALRWAS
jgi:hypothetical protein